MSPLPAGRRRARSAGEKDARRAGLVAAARAALAAHDYDAVTIADVARAAGLAKGTAYLYFPTKEALFLAVLTEDLAAWFAGLPAAIAARRDAAPERRIARAVAATISAAPGLVDLLSLVHTRLEMNTPDGELRAFKHFLSDAIAAAGAVIGETLGVPPARGMELLLRAHALAIGLGQMAAEPPHLAALFAAEPELAHMRVAFEATFASCLEDMMRGWRAEGAR